MSIEIRSGSILDFEGDCIVNPANSFMRHGAGLAAIIDRTARVVFQPKGVVPMSVADIKATIAADEALVARYEADLRNTPLTATGNVAVTSAGTLKYEGIIHAVGPIWNGGDFMEHDLLEILTENVLEAAQARGWKSVALPAISCGIFGFPVEDAARTLVSVAWGYEPCFDTIAFYPFGHELVFEDAVEQYGS